MRRRLKVHVIGMGSASKLLAQIKFWADISYRMLRIRTVLLMITFEAIGYESATPTRSVSLKFILAATMFSALYICATCFNDAADEQIDKVNLPNDASRPLVTTNVTAKQLRRLGVLALLVALAAAIAVKPAYLLLVTVGAALNIFYSVPPIKASHRGIIASLWLSLSYVALPFLAGALISNASLSRQTIYILAGSYGFFVSRILLKDFRDYEGDKKFGKLNFLVRHGPGLTCFVSALAWLVGDTFFSLSLYSDFPVLVFLIQPLTLIIFYELYILSREKHYDLKLREVAVIGRMGNSVALAMLTTLTLQASAYSNAQDNLFTVAVGLVVALTAIEPQQRKTLSK